MGDEFYIVVVIDDTRDKRWKKYRGKREGEARVEGALCCYICAVIFCCDGVDSRNNIARSR